MYDAEYVKRLKETRMTLGRCPICGRKQDMENRVTCSECMYRAQMYRIAHAEQIREYTQTHKEQQRERNRKHREKMIAEGRCPNCGRKTGKHTRCEVCLAKLREKYYQYKLTVQTVPKPRKGGTPPAPGTDHAWRLSNKTIRKRGEQ